jgi:ribosome-associated translation inhibitor RaiA
MAGRALVSRARDVPIDVVWKRDAPDDTTLRYARRKIAAAARASRAPVRFGRVKITHQPDPSIARPAIVAMTLDVDGRLVRAHAAGRTTREAVDIAEERLRRQLVDVHHRLAFRRRRRRERGIPGEWRHGGIASPRPDYYPRPPEEREVVRRKTPSLGWTTSEAAAAEMQALDHDFHLFINAATGREAIVQRIPGGTYEVGPSPVPLTLDEGIERLNVTDEPFVFFVDAGTARGAVLYRRYDGHYGVVTAATGADTEDARKEEPA